MEIALDFAINRSPDHPYVREHPDWFYKRPDGTIKYAENPPKKYEDIYPLNFRCANWRDLWAELKSVVLFWAGRGVRIFRVDNPHTKPVAFWEYLIGGVREKYPDTIFLSEAFTKPKMKKALTKDGFNQGYTNLRFHDAENDAILFYSKMTAARDNIILVVVNLDPHRKQNSFVYVPIESFGQMESDAYQVQDLLSGATYSWRGRRNYVELDPDVQPAHIFLVRR